MRIGILTQPLHNNYGGIMQNFALQQVLIQMGIEPVTIDHNSKIPVWWKRILYKGYYYYWLLLHPSLIKNQKYQLSDKENAIISKNTSNFIKKYINKTESFKNEKELQKIIHEGDYDGYVVGSDQCWRPTYSGGFLKEMFLSFADNNVKRVAYAASFGTDQWEFSPEMTTVCTRLAKKFDLITVREKSGIDLCKKFLGVDASHVLDPTMLLSREDYLRLVEKEHEPVCPGTLFYYILDPCNEKTNFIQRIAFEEGVKPFTVLPRCQAENRTKKDVKDHIEDCIYPSVTSWIRGFADAKMVVVDSFHGAVFSIIFNKPFWVISNSTRGNARFASLLEMFHLSERLVQPSELGQVNYRKEIDWGEVNIILNEKKNLSMRKLAVLKK